MDESLTQRRMLFWSLRLAVSLSTSAADEEDDVTTPLQSQQLLGVAASLMDCHAQPLCFGLVSLSGQRGRLSRV